MCDIDCLSILPLHLVLFAFSSSVVAVESGGSGASVVGKGGVSTQSVCPADTTIMPPVSVSVWLGCWVGPRRKYLYLFPRCYFSGPHGFIKSFGGYFGSFGGGFAFLPVGANGHWVIFLHNV